MLKIVEWTVNNTMTSLFDTLGRQMFDTKLVFLFECVDALLGILHNRWKSRQKDHGYGGSAKAIGPLGRALRPVEFTWFHPLLVGGKCHIKVRKLPRTLGTSNKC